MMGHVAERTWTKLACWLIGMLLVHVAIFGVQIWHEYWAIHVCRVALVAAMVVPPLWRRMVR